MPLSLIATILGALVPELVQLAEKQFGAGVNPAKRQWVVDGVHAVLVKVESFEPSWAKTATAGLEPLLDEAINLALNKAGFSA